MNDVFVFFEALTNDLLNATGNFMKKVTCIEYLISIFDFHDNLSVPFSSSLCHVVSFLSQYLCFCMIFEGWSDSRSAL